MRYEARAYNGEILYANIVADNINSALVFCDRQLIRSDCTRVVVNKVPPVPIAETWKGVLHLPGDRSRAKPVQVVEGWNV